MRGSASIRPGRNCGAEDFYRVNSQFRVDIARGDAEPGRHPLDSEAGVAAFDENASRRSQRDFELVPGRGLSFYCTLLIS